MNLPGEPAPDHLPDGPNPEPAGRPDRRRIDEIFGDVLPDVTMDERDIDRRAGHGSPDDRWYLDNRPPHHE